MKHAKSRPYITMSTILDANSVEEFQQIAAANEKVLVFFWAHWSQPCKALDELLPDVLELHPGIKCVKVRTSCLWLQVLTSKRFKRLGGGCMRQYPRHTCRI